MPPAGANEKKKEEKKIQKAASLHNQGAVTQQILQDLYLKPGAAADPCNST